MGFGSSFKDFVSKTTPVAAVTTSGGRDFLEKGGAGIGGLAISKLINNRRKDSGLAPASQEQITTANLFQNLSREQQKDLLLNNPNIETAQGKQFFDPLTNTVRLEESEFQTGQRGRQEQLASELSGQLTGQTLPGTDPAARFESGRELLTPAFQEERERLEQQLADQGIPRGSEAHTKELDRLERSQGTQLQSLQRESVATTEAQRSARFNEISSLLGQQQVGGVGFGGFQSGFQGIDLAGIEESQRNRVFQGEQLRQQRSADKRNAIIGAIGGFGSGAVGAFASDKTLKENIEEIGLSESGIPIYHFDYINKNFGQFRYEGVMAQDLEELKPEAIITMDSGAMAVNYDLIDVNFKRIN